jgi:hypothetical protein
MQSGKEESAQVIKRPAPRKPSIRQSESRSHAGYTSAIPRQASEEGLYLVKILKVT